MHRNPTIRDVAREAGVAPATASLALRNHPRLRKSTCAKVQRVAKTMGYRANAVVSHLLAQLRASRTPKYQATLGLINVSENRGILGEIHTFREWVRGLKERAAQLGYGVNDFWLHESGLTPERLAGIFKAQNIRGVIIAGWFGNCALPEGFDEIWKGFASVLLGVRGIRPSVHLVCNDQFSTIRQAFAEALKLGYRRPALVISREVDSLVEDRFSGGFLTAQTALPVKQRVPPFYTHSRVDVPLAAKIGTADVMRRFGVWFRRQQPDVILCIHPEVKEWVASLGTRAARDAGLIHLDWTPELKGWAGMNQNSGLIGAAAVDMLVGQLHRNELGVPSFPKSMMIESSWIAGDTARAHAAGGR